MNQFLERSRELEPWLTEIRRYLHQNPELGTVLPGTTLYVKERLRGLGCEVSELAGGGLVCLLGKNVGRTVMLRADMDALPLKEESGLPFASRTPNAAHCCGHDIHAAFLLGAARLLKERERELNGMIKLLFQSGEETLEGARNALRSNVLEAPHVDRAIGIHVQPSLPLGTLHYPKGAFLSSTDTFEVEIQGKGGHAGQPYMGIDPIHISAHVILGLQSLQVKEIPADCPVVLNVCEITSGSASNIVPDKAVMRGTLRTFDNELRKRIKRRIIQIAEATADMFGGGAVVRFTGSCPCTVNDPEFVDSLAGALPGFGVEFITASDYRMQVSDDFGFISEQVPSVMFIIGCRPDTGSAAFNHSPRVTYNEKVLPVGAALLAHEAFCWLKTHR